LEGKMSEQELKQSSGSDKKEAIFTAAAKLFANEGFYRVSVREICEAAGVTKPVLYYYFKDKETLLLELVKETSNVAQELVKKHSADTDDFRQFLKGLVNLYADFISKYPHLFRLAIFVQFMVVPESVRQLKYEIDSQNLKIFREQFSHAQEQNILTKDADPILLAHNYLGTIIMIVSNHFRANSSHEDLFNNLNEFYEFWNKHFLVEKS
jgi:AcrR family transcriptional regulator